jgi:general secretion pathway protein J
MLSNAPDASSRGFALIEVLASLVVIGMMALLMVAGMTTGRRVWEGIDRREAAGEALDNAQIMLRNRIEQIYPMTKYDGNPPYIDFQGVAQGLTFLANPPEADRPAPLRRYSLFVDAAGELVLSSISDVSPEQGAAIDNQVLLRQVRQLDISYFGPVNLDRHEGWRRDWRDQAALPEIVRVRVTFEPGDARSWPDLMIHPRTTIDTLCLLNPATHRCKGRI